MPTVSGMLHDQMDWPIRSWKSNLPDSGQQTCPIHLPKWSPCSSPCAKQKVRCFLFYCCLVIQSCPTLCDPMDSNPLGSSVHGVFQARILEWIVISFSRGSSQPRDWTQVSHTVDRRFAVWATREVLITPYRKTQMNVLANPMSFYVSMYLPM